MSAKERYRFDAKTGVLRVWDEAQKCFIVAAYAKGRTESETITAYEQAEEAVAGGAEPVAYIKLSLVRSMVRDADRYRALRAAGNALLWDALIEASYDKQWSKVDEIVDNYIAANADSKR